MRIKNLVFFCSLLSAQAFASDDYDYEALAPFLETYQLIVTLYPYASVEELDEILKSQLNSHESLREVEGTEDLDYAGVVNEVLPPGAKLKPDEITLFNQSPFKGLAVVNAGRSANSKAQDLYQPYTLHNGNGDAFRHCFWNELMVQATDQEFAKAWGTAHEEFPGNPILEKRMDLQNNNDGRRFAPLYPNESEQERSERCKSAVYLQRLVRIESSTLVPTDSSGRL